MSRKRKSREKPSFFKVLSRTDLSKLLRLPPTFMRWYGDLLNVRENVKLRVDGRSWNVKLERSENGMFCFTNGWKEFAEDAALQLGEFLVFSLLAKSDFEVVIYETSLCQREIIVPAPSSPLQDDDVKDEGGTDADGGEILKKGKRSNSYFKEGNPLYFATYLKKHHYSRINLPKEFTEASNMKEKKQVRIERVGRSGRGAYVEVSLERYRVDLTRGWVRFCEANGLDLDCGKMYSFEFNPHNQVIYVKELICSPYHPT